MEMPCHVCDGNPILVLLNLGETVQKCIMELPGIYCAVVYVSSLAAQDAYEINFSELVFPWVEQCRIDNTLQA